MEQDQIEAGGKCCLGQISIENRHPEFAEKPPDIVLFVGPRGVMMGEDLNFFMVVVEIEDIERVLAGQNQQDQQKQGGCIARARW